MLCKFPTSIATAGGFVPCGRCLPCRVNKQKDKSSRSVLEAHMSDTVHYVTATYDSEHLPTEYKHWDGTYFTSLSGTLNPNHPKNFIKRLRSAIEPHKFRYYMVGEYGDEKARPHYHFIFYGFPEEQTWRLYDSWHDGTPDRTPLCHPDRFEVERPRSAWDVSLYVSGYVIKKMTRQDDARLNGAFPEFFRSSKGIGLAMVDSIVDALNTESGWSFIYEFGNIPRTVHLMGKPLKIDRYMKEKILDALDKIQPGIKEKIKQVRYGSYQKEMQDLRFRAKASATSPKQILDDDNRQSLKNFERKFELFNPKHKGINHG
nr:MAG: replication initiator protein [Microvirus sp.]